MLLVVYLHLLVWPLVQTHRLDFGNVSTKTTMDAAALNADEDAKVNVSPIWIWRGIEREEGRGEEKTDFIELYVLPNHCEVFLG